MVDLSMHTIPAGREARHRRTCIPKRPEKTLFGVFWGAKVWTLLVKQFQNEETARTFVATSSVRLIAAASLQLPLLPSCFSSCSTVIGNFSSLESTMRPGCLSRGMCSMSKCVWGRTSNVNTHTHTLSLSLSLSVSVHDPNSTMPTKGSRLYKLFCLNNGPKIMWSQWPEQVLSFQLEGLHMSRSVPGWEHIAGAQGRGARLRGGRTQIGSSTYQRWKPSFEIDQQVLDKFWTEHALIVRQG